ncbi:hypothetical protein [Mycobacteroides abscessus]|uniref:hypothetical protein n=1 Tax=Mycobacteroides abscessus TaxID=36809 RepID=UPI000C25825F|nr:hypothetical protein [Mycobacteroides abscessus]RIR96191.1 hypothetical protein D2E50_00815 [Mycobacteroides abscessus]RIU31418.1 hypothetical protein D2E86_01205 [Mycobacteroides abscessus]
MDTIEELCTLGRRYGWAVDECPDQGLVELIGPYGHVIDMNDDGEFDASIRANGVVMRSSSCVTVAASLVEFGVHENVRAALMAHH